MQISCLLQNLSRTRSHSCFSQSTSQLLSQTCLSLLRFPTILNSFHRSLSPPMGPAPRPEDNSWSLPYSPQPAAGTGSLQSGQLAGVYNGGNGQLSQHHTVAVATQDTLADVSRSALKIYTMMVLHPKYVYRCYLAPELTQDFFGFGASNYHCNGLVNYAPQPPFSTPYSSGYQQHGASAAVNMHDPLPSSSSVPQFLPSSAQK